MMRKEKIYRQAILIVIIDVSCEHEIGLILEEATGDTIEGSDFRRTKRGKKSSRLRNSQSCFLIISAIGNYLQAFFGKYI